MQGVAQATADAFNAALAQVSCVGELYTGASALAAGLAQDTQLAITGVYAQVSIVGLLLQSSAAAAVSALRVQGLVCTCHAGGIFGCPHSSHPVSPACWVQHAEFSQCVLLLLFCVS